MDMPRIAHVTMPLSSEGSSIAHVVRALTHEHRAAGGTSVVVTSHNRQVNFPDAEILEVDYTRNCPKEYFTKKEYLFDAVVGALGGERPHGARIFEPAIDALATLEPDWVVLHEGHYAVTALPMLRRALPKSCQIALHVHNRISRSCLRPELSRLLKHASLVLGVSNFVVQQITDRVGIGEDKVRTLYNGVDLTRFTPAPWRPDDGRFRLLYVGQVDPHKGVHLLLGSLVSLGDASRRFDVHIVGSAEHRVEQSLSAYETLLRELASRTKANVRFTPYTPQSGIASAYRWADAVCMPSAAEPFGMVAIEAMASGVLVLANNSGGLPEVVGDVGRRVEPNEAGWVAALSDVSRSEARRVREPSIVRASRFTWTEAYVRLIKLLQEASVDSARRRRGRLG